MEVIFTGRVQGVGFRFTASSIARKFPVTGFVRNLSDGNVELVAEGEEEILKNFLAAIRTSQMSDNIRGVDSGWKQPENVFKAFSIEA